ncbi:hypothetical protein M422DRAFT_241777 [Sphaerobolus stellatus SS14]|nr:hypothetical protein M422DRAFT_241777 [Sphaerobolus stellatus SS14]
MNHEIISGNPAPHDAIHDIESFWWILVHLALTREGPGKRREEHSVALNDIIEEYSDGSILHLRDAKRATFKDLDPQERLESKLLENFHPYFEPVKNLIYEWWSLLRLGFDFRRYEYHNIHACTLELLRTAIDKLDDETDELTKKEDARRVKYHEATKTAIRTKKRANSIYMPPPKDKSESQKPAALAIEPASPTPSGRPIKRLRE